VTALLLPQEPAPVSRRAAALTRRHLMPAASALMALFQALRAETDAALGGAAPHGKPYPLGCCREITIDVQDRLRARLARPDRDDAGMRALRAFLRAGGTCRCVWGVLRDRYFQTALQLGGLYVDVANDTVVVTKPKVEMLPMAESGLVAIRGPAHFAAIADAYWGMTIYANHALPSLAPVLPMIGVNARGIPALQSPTDYMMALFQRDRFAQSEAWLADGPPPPPAAVAALRDACPADLLGANPAATAAAAVAACRTARAARETADAAWLDARLADYHRIAPPRAAAAPAAARSAGTVMTCLHLGPGDGPDGLHPAFRGPAWRAARPGGDPSGATASVADATMDAVWAPHRIQRLPRHDVAAALADYRRVLKPDGLAVVVVPDLQRAAERIAAGASAPAVPGAANAPAASGAANAPAAPDAAPLDLLYGTAEAPNRSGFTARSLAEALVAAGFVRVIAQRDGDEVWAVAYCREQPPEVVASTTRLRDRLPAAAARAAA